MKNPNNSSNQNAKPSYDVWKGSYRIAISLAAAAIGLSCIATDASARGGGFGGGIGGGHMGGMAMGGHMGGMNFGAPGIGGRSFAAPGFNRGFYGGAGGGRPGSPPPSTSAKICAHGPGCPWRQCDAGCATLCSTIFLQQACVRILSVSTLPAPALGLASVAAS
jgi:hypothetical protein